MSFDDIGMVTQYLEVSVRGTHEFLRFPLVPSNDPADLEEHLTNVDDLWPNIRVLRYMVIQLTFRACVGSASSPSARTRWILGGVSPAIV